MTGRNDPFDFFEFVETFRQSLSAPDASQQAALKDMVVKYGSLCEEANGRLRECAVLAQKGLYANAVALAEQDPNLIERCSGLEIPERDLLSTVATALGIHAPALLNRDLVEVLQETYLKGASAEGNARTLHRLTLARAPLPTRLAIMRRLLIQDPNRPFIDSDIRTFERAWFKRASEFAQPFAKAGNVEVVEGILADLHENGYLETPPQQLIAGLQAQLAKARSIQLPALAAEIQQAFQAKSAEQLQQLVPRWKELVAKSGIADASSRYQIEPALQWYQRTLAEIAKKSEFSIAQSRLIEILANPNANRQNVTKAYQAAQLLRATDANLEARYELWLNARRRRNGIIAGASSGILIIVVVAIAVGYLLQFGSSAQQEEIAFVDHLNELIQARKYQAALDEADKAEQSLAGNPKIQAIQKAARDALDRSAAFDRAIRKLKSATARDDFEALGKNALDFARDDTDRKQVEDFLANLRRIDTPKADKQKGKGSVDPDNVSVKLAEFLSDMSKATATDESLKKSADFLCSTLAKDHPDDETRQRAMAAKRDLTVWQKVLGLKERFETGRIDAVLQKEWAGTPPDAVINTSLGTMEMLRQRDFTDPKSEAFNLKKRLESPDIKDVYIIRIERAEPYCYWYTKKPLEAGENPVDWKVITDVDGGNIIHKIHGRRRAAILSPQSKLLSEIETLWLEPTPSDRWQQKLGQVYDRLANDNDIEPLLKLQLMRRFLKLAVASSLGYRQILEPLSDFQRIFGSEGIVEGNWFDPKNVMNEQRTRAAKICDSSPLLLKWAEAAAERDNTELKKAKEGINLVGLLQQTEGHKVAVARFTKPASIGESRLYVISEGIWIAIGSSAQNNQIQFEQVANRFIGWPVFSVRASPTR